MGGFKQAMLGGEMSGTPLETRQGTADIAQLLNRMVQTGSISKLGMQTAVNGLDLGNVAGGINVEGLGIEDALRAGLAAPASDPDSFLQKYAAAMEPFRQEALRDQKLATDALFGAGTSGLFSTNRVQAQQRGARELNQAYDANMMNAYAQIMDQYLGEIARAGNLGSNLTLGLGNLDIAQQQAQIAQNALGQDAWRSVLQFFAPGAPNYQQGALGDLLGAAGTAAAALINPAAGAAMAAQQIAQPQAQIAPSQFPRINISQRPIGTSPSRPPYTPFAY